MTTPMRTLVLVLTLSVAVNFALAGFLAASFFRQSAFEQISAAFDVEPPEALRTAFAEAIREDRTALFAALRQLRTTTNASHGILTATDYDPVALEAAQGDVRTAVVGLLEVLQSALRTAVGRLPEDERRNIPRQRALDFVKDGRLQERLLDDP